MSTLEALFTPDSGRFVPGEGARGPWSPDALHGGPVAALVARAAEQYHHDPAMHLARLTLELVRPVAPVPLTVSCTMVRPGRKVQVVDVTVAAGSTTLAIGRALRIRTHEEGDWVGEGLPRDPTGPVPGVDDGAPAGPESGGHSPPLVEGYRAFHNAGAELRFVAGRFDGRGPASVWVRLAMAVVAGETPSPVQRAAAAADFGNGVSSVLDYSQYIFINPDLTLYLDRPPEGEWICLEAATRLGAPGVGVAQSALWDHRGPVGRSLQGLVVERRS